MVCRQEVLCLYLRHVIKCALIVKIFTGRKVKMPKAGENLRHIIKSSVEKVLENYSSTQTHKHIQTLTHTHRQVEPESTAALSALPCAERDFCQKIDKQPKIEENSIEFNWQTYQFILTSFSLSIIAKSFHSLCRFSCFSIC